MNWFKKIKHNYNLFTSDLSFSTIETLFKSDAPTLLSFYSNGTENTSKNGFIRFLVLVKNITFAFIQKLSPARRLLFLVAIYFFFSAVFTPSLINTVMAFSLVTLLLAFELADKLTAKDELEVARSIQQSLLPKEAPINASMEIAYFSEAAREVGGDYYDFYQNESSSMIVIGDISGKGMAAALHMVQVNTIMKSLNKEENLKDLVVEFNNKLQNLFPPSVFLTSSFLKLDENNNVVYCRAGHLPLIYYSFKEKTCNQISPSGIGIAIQSGAEKFENTLQENSLKVETNDIMVLYTDGLTETMNKNGDEFSEEKLRSLVCENTDLSADELKQLVLKKIAEFRGTVAPHDDLTLIILKAK
jgi:phosphoserine phosphatase RsbU/P